jgi:hypothetical protein
MTDDVIPIARGREPLWAGPHLPLREAILEAIREYALEEKSDDAMNVRNTRLRYWSACFWTLECLSRVGRTNSGTESSQG